MSEPPRTYAGFFRRVAAWAIDLFFVMAASLFFGGVTGLLFYFVILQLHLDQDIQAILLKGVGCVLGGVIYVAYFAGFESSKLQATPGKKAIGLIVTDLNGSRISFWRACARLLGKILSGFLFCFGFLVCLVTEHKQCLHDILAHTLVYKAEPAKPAGSKTSEQ